MCFSSLLVLFCLGVFSPFLYGVESAEMSKDVNTCYFCARKACLKTGILEGNGILSRHLGSRSCKKMNTYETQVSIFPKWITFPEPDFGGLYHCSKGRNHLKTPTFNADYYVLFFRKPPIFSINHAPDSSSLSIHVLN